MSMQLGHSTHVLPGAPYAFRRKEHSEPAILGPRRNRLLAMLPLADFERLLPELVPVPLTLGSILHYAGDLEEHLYFVTAGVVARYYVMESGASDTYAITGSEGAIGIATFLGGNSTPGHAKVICAGEAYRIGVGRLKSNLEHVSELMILLLRYTQALITQTTQTAICNRHHSVQQQLCRWMLSCLDRLPSNVLAMSQENIGDMLGVRREGITEAAGHLREAGVIDYSRGRIAVLDRPALLARACECYGVVKSEIERLIPAAVMQG
jgi:CRP-like cAMP-binding protein